MKIQKGAPTEYGFSLPKIRYELSYSNIEGNLNLLDFGCGNGANTVFYEADFKNIVGIDIEDVRIEEARNFANSKKLENVTYSKYDGKVIPYSDNYFDTVISYEVIEHTNNDADAIREIFRVLKKNGKFILTVPNRYYLMETHGFNLPFNSIIPYNRIPFLNLLPSWFYNKYGNARIYSYKHISTILKNEGFQIVTHSYIKAPLDKISNKFFKIFINKFINLLPNEMGVSIFIVCQK